MKYIAKIVYLFGLLSVAAIFTSAQTLHPAEENKTAKTIISNFPTIIEFRNDSNKTVKIYWLDEQGKRKFSVTLAPKQSNEIKTFLGEPWLVTDERDNALSLYYPDAQPRIINIRDNEFNGSYRNEDDDYYASRPAKDYNPIKICANQPIPRGFLIIEADSEWNCPNWTATGKNSYTIKRPSPTAPTKVCSNQNIPRSFVITAVSAEWGCPNWTATGKNAYTITRPKDEQVMCSVSEVPRGFVVVASYNEWNCPNWTANGSNARRIKRVR